MCFLHKYNMELFKELYSFEIDRRKDLNLRLVLPINIILPIIGVDYVHFLKILENGFVLSNLISIIFGIHIYFFGRAIYFVIKAFFGHTYKFLPNPNIYDDYARRLKSDYTDYSSHGGIRFEEIEENVRLKIKEFVYEGYKDATENNLEINDNRLNLFKKSLENLIRSIILIIIFIVLFNVFDCLKIDKSNKIDSVKTSTPTENLSNPSLSPSVSPTSIIEKG